MVEAGDRHLHPFGVDRPQAAIPVLQPVHRAAHRLGGRQRSRRAACLAHSGRGLTADAMRLLLTGSSGWLGRHLAPRLRAAGHAVIGLDVAPGIETEVLGSVADRALVERTFGEQGVEAVIHAGALHKPDIVRYPESAFWEVNVEGTRNLLEAAAKAAHDRFLFTSTTSLMITPAIRAGEAGGASEAAWLDEDF